MKNEIPTCIDCGKIVWRGTSKRCWDCWKKLVSIKDPRCRPTPKIKPKIVSHCVVCGEEIFKDHKHCRKCWDILLTTDQNPMKLKKKKYPEGSLESVICICGSKKCSGSKICMSCRKIELSSDKNPCHNSNNFFKRTNPMKDPKILAKSLVSHRKTYAQEGYVHPNTGKRNEWSIERRTNNNPMKDPIIAAKSSGERHWSHTQPENFAKHLKNIFAILNTNGHISKGQKALYSALNNLKIKFFPEQQFIFKGEPYSYIFVDAYNPINNIAWEYDGFYTHRDGKGPKLDSIRDRLLKFCYGVKTIRILPEDLPNLESIIVEKLQCLNG